MRIFLSIVFALLVVVGNDVARAVELKTPSKDEVLEDRLNTLSSELRCLVCQNQSLADSHADLAIDLKNQIREMMRQGRSDAEIKAYLTHRYGDFVLYRPPMKTSTWFLWIGPFVLLVVGIAALARAVRQRRRRLAEAVPEEVDTATRERARALLADDGPGAD
ncbi:MAG: cytochrome c-type biogenesis protein CcmH [Betaproteobacteria bacterium]|nr:cytochrome c-type biogenesis protein CcmH [Betaproteobacteria bacterium]